MKSKVKTSTYANQSLTYRDKYKPSLPRGVSLTHLLMYNSDFKGCIIKIAFYIQNTNWLLLVYLACSSLKLHK